MATNRPVYEVRLGRIKACVWANQTERGVRVRFCANGPIDPAVLSQSIATGLRGCGLADPEVTLEKVPELSRQVSGKLKRFVPRATK